jgi:hypothetical protein
MKAPKRVHHFADKPVFRGSVLPDQPPSLYFSAMVL